MFTGENEVTKELKAILKKRNIQDLGKVKLICRRVLKKEYTDIDSLSFKDKKILLNLLKK